MSLLLGRPEFGTATSRCYKVGSAGTIRDKNPEPTKPYSDPTWHFPCPEIMLSFTCRRISCKNVPETATERWKTERLLPQGVTVRVRKTMTSPWHRQIVHLCLSCTYILSCVLSQPKFSGGCFPADRKYCNPKLIQPDGLSLRVCGGKVERK